MKQVIKPCQRLYGGISPPGDKSISHRAIIFNSIASGKAKIANISASADVKSTIACMQALGVNIKYDIAESIISGVGSDGLKEPHGILKAGNSGTTTRLLTGLLAAQPFTSSITGDESLQTRPMDRVIEPLRQMGADISGRDNNLVPLTIKGRQLHGIEYRLPIASAQVKSAIILAALYTQGKTIIEEPLPSRDHTERMLTAMGADIKKNNSRITISPNTIQLSPLELTIPGDISAAAFWLVAGAIHPNAQITLIGIGINPTRDGIIEVLTGMGAEIKIENRKMEGGEPIADLSIKSGNLTGINIEGDLIPRLIDEIPVIAVAASVAEGTTVIRDAGELRVKETDRITTIVKELSKLGVNVEELPDGLIIHGQKQLTGAECDSHQDHRLAMALGVAGLVANGETTIYNAEAVQYSYTDFWEDLKKLAHY